MNVKSKSTSCLVVAGVFVGALAGCATDRHDASARHETMTERVDDGWIGRRASACPCHVTTSTYSEDVNGRRSH